jgi:hypothetical protein
MNVLLTAISFPFLSLQGFFALGRKYGFIITPFTPQMTTINKVHAW